MKPWLRTALMKLLCYFVFCAFKVQPLPQFVIFCSSKIVPEARDLICFYPYPLSMGEKLAIRGSLNLMEDVCRVFLM